MSRNGVPRDRITPLAEIYGIYNGAVMRPAREFNRRGRGATTEEQGGTLRASMSSWRLLNGTKAEDVDGVVAYRLASFPPKGLVSAFAVRTVPEAVTVVVVDGGAADDALHDLAERLAGRAEPIEEQIGQARDLVALADDGRVALS